MHGTNAIQCQHTRSTQCKVCCKGWRLISRYKQTQISNPYRTDRTVHGRVGMVLNSSNHAQGCIRQNAYIMLKTQHWSWLSSKSRNMTTYSSEVALKSTIAIACESSTVFVETNYDSFANVPLKTTNDYFPLKTTNDYFVSVVFRIVYTTEAVSVQILGRGTYHFPFLPPFLPRAAGDFPRVLPLSLPFFPLPKGRFGVSRLCERLRPTERSRFPFALPVGRFSRAS